MEINDLLLVLRRLGVHWKRQKRDVPELFLVLEAFEHGGEISFDTVSAAQKLETSKERLEKRLRKLQPLGISYVSEEGRGALHLLRRPAAPSRFNFHQTLNIGEEVFHNGGEVFHNPPTLKGATTRAERDAGATRARVAGAQLRARVCSVQEQPLVLSSSVLVPAKRAPFLAYTEEANPWSWYVPYLAKDVLHLVGADLSAAHLPATLSAVYSAADYLGGPQHLIPVVEAALAAPPGGSFKGWKFYLQSNLAEYLLRIKLLDEYSAKSNAHRKRETYWEEQCERTPQLRTLEVIAKSKFGDKGVFFLLSQDWKLEAKVLTFECPFHYSPDFREVFLRRMEPVLSQFQNLTTIEVK